MSAERKVDENKYIAALALACLIFIAGIFLGYIITKGKVSDILNVEKETRYELDSLALEEKLLEDASCSNKNPKIISEKLEDLATKLAYLETEYSKDDPSIIELKKPYTLLELQHYLTLKNIVKECNLDYSFILFFYSNSPEYIDESERQGFVLEYLQKKFTSEKLKIYSFDVDSNLRIINSLKESYGITTIPSSVIDGKVYAGFHDKDEFDKILLEKYSESL